MRLVRSRFYATCLFVLTVAGGCSSSAKDTNQNDTDAATSSGGGSDGGASTGKPDTKPSGDAGTISGDCKPTGGSGKSSTEKLEYCDPKMKCYEFLAHAPGDKTAKFMVSTQPDLYTNFTFMPPWKGQAYARSFASIIDNDKVIHHWLLYKNAAAGTDGDVQASIGAHPGSELLHGWAPGANDVYYDSDLGQEMQDSVAYVLETHHNNTTGSEAPDATGVRICVTPTAPKYVAGVSWLGTDNISGTTASGVCDPTTDQPIHILGINPHMHTKGTHMSVILTRADGKVETMHDAPFAFADQRSFLVDFIVNAGDTIKTTCTYSEPATFGEKTTQEMCYAFTLAYPKLALTNGNLLGTLVHGPNTCLN